MRGAGRRFDVDMASTLPRTPSPASCQAAEPSRKVRDDASGGSGRSGHGGTARSADRPVERSGATEGNLRVEGIVAHLPPLAETATKSPAASKVEVEFSQLSVMCPRPCSRCGLGREATVESRLPPIQTGLHSSEEWAITTRRNRRHAAHPLRNRPRSRSGDVGPLRRPRCRVAPRRSQKVRCRQGLGRRPCARGRWAPRPPTRCRRWLVSSRTRTRMSGSTSASRSAKSARPRSSR